MNYRLITIITLIFFFSCDNDVAQPTEENPLLGKWTEPFTWTDPFDCVTIGWETDCPAISETSTIEFTESTFEVKVLPPSRTFIVEDDTIYVGWAGDTLFTGSYEFSNDTIMFNRNNSVEPTNMKYWFQNDSLHLSAIGEVIFTVIDGDTSYIKSFAICSFVWGNAWGKTYGVFSKID